MRQDPPKQRAPTLKKKTSPPIKSRRIVQAAGLASAAATTPDSTLSPGQQKLKEVWEEHMRCEFATKSVDDTMAIMGEGGHINHVPTMTGGQGLKAIRDFYTRCFIPQMPPDTKTTLISRTIGETQIVDEMIFEFTHTVPMDWMLPGIAPTGKRVEVALVAIIGFRESKVSHEHIYWDQASVLVQLGLLDASLLPVAGRGSADKVRNPGLPSNQLIQRAAAGI